ncbi:MAG: TIM44-like domain-containing protein [Bacilli bacterium]|nr:TIM44-like domain-containing protein [Bacilli bacterium]
MKLNWKKAILFCTIILITGILTVFIIDKLGYDFKVLSNDSGFDSDFGGGSFGGSTGGGFGGSGSTGGSFGGGNIYDSSPGPVIILGIILIIFLIYLSFVFKSPSSANEEMYNEILQKYGINSTNDLKKMVYDSYVKIQQAWSANDIDKVRHLLSDEMYNTYKMQIMTMINKNQRNAMSDFKYIDAYIENISEKDTNIIIKVSLDVNCKDYMIDIKSGMTIKGKSNRINHYSYSLTFVLGKNNNVSKCPNCNAKLKKQGKSVKCDYCGSVIEREINELVLIDKKMIKQGIK